MEILFIGNYKIWKKKVFFTINIYHLIDDNNDVVGDDISGLQYFFKPSPLRSAAVHRLRTMQLAHCQKPFYAGQPTEYGRCTWRWYTTTAKLRALGRC